MLKEIQYKTIPHSDQRYKTVGDYFEDREGKMQFRVSDMRNSDYEFLVLIHELIEWYLCRRAGVKIEDIDAFDMKFEREREEGKHSDDAEPGDHPSAPYGWAHRFATKIEKKLAKRLGVDWGTYDKRVASL